MANAAVTWRVTVKQNSGGSIAQRERNSSAGALITQAGITSITARYRLVRGGPITTVSLDKTACVFDSLQTDQFWKDVDGIAYDSIGYNFRWDYPATIFTKPEPYYVTFIFTPTTGAAWPDNLHVTVNPQLV